VNADLWNAHLENLALRRRLQRAYAEANKQRWRAELWKQRALTKPKRTKAGVRAVSGREPARQPPSQRGGL
jgi:hypothetical protein